MLGRKRNRQNSSRSGHVGVGTLFRCAILTGSDVGVQVEIQSQIAREGGARMKVLLRLPLRLAADSHVRQ